MRFWHFIIILAAVAFVSCNAFNYSNYIDDPYGQPTGFCYDRSEPYCCPSRDDDCGVPDRGTICYCDYFCQTSKDCCTDVEATCYGKPEPIKYCTLDGKYYRPGENVQVYCNYCTCEDRGKTMNWNCTMQTCIIDEMLIDEIQQVQNDWVPGKPEQFRTWTLRDGMDRALGTQYSSRKVSSSYPKHLSVRHKSLPRAFDARTRWPQLITPPPDQRGCGGSWAFSTVSVASDRWNIMSNGTFHGKLSVQHLISCNLGNRPGCRGGRLTKGWSWINSYGLAKEEAYPWTGDQTRCRLTKRKGAKLARFNNTNIRTELYYTSPIYRISSDKYQIMKEIMDNGPVQATMDVFRGFFLYKSGIYSCPKIYRRNQVLHSIPSINTYPGFHSVRIIGWGEEYKHGRLIEYWIVSNSWGDSWGENGYFRIKRGVNSCKIEDVILANWVHKN